MTPLLTTPDKAELYRTALEMLNRSGVPYMVGGTYAFQYYAGISRTTKDFDIFVRPRDVQRILEVLTRAGFKTEIAFSHWLAKAHHGDKFIDVIYSSGNGVAEVDDEWFAHAVDEEVLGAPVKLCPPEEMIWSKAMIMERERYDGADVAHLLRHCSGLLNWERLVRRFGNNWRVLLSHLVLFGFIYPGERALIPSARDEGSRQPLAGRTRSADPQQQGLPGNAAVAGAVPGRRRRMGLRGRARHAPRIDDGSADRGVDRRDRQVATRVRISVSLPCGDPGHLERSCTAIARTSLVESTAARTS